MISVAQHKLSESNVSSNQDDLVHELEEGSASRLDSASRFDNEPEGERTPLPPRKSISCIPLGIEGEGETTPLPSRKSISNLPPARLNSLSSQKLNQKSIWQTSSSNEFIEITPLSLLPSYKITNFEGRISMHFIKETHLSLEQNTMSGMGGFNSLLIIGLFQSFFMK
jgi:hypothetical protein